MRKSEIVFWKETLCQQVYGLMLMSNTGKNFAYYFNNSFTLNENKFKRITYISYKKSKLYYYSLFNSWSFNKLNQYIVFNLYSSTK